MSAYDADELFERVDRALDRDIPTTDEVTTRLAVALDELERKYPDGQPGPGTDSLAKLQYRNLISRVTHCKWQLENGQCVEFPRGRRSRLDPAERDEDSSWTEFLAEHPELADASPVGGATKEPVVERPPMTFTDAELLKALRRACREWGKRLPSRRKEGVLSSSVAWVLAGVSDLDGRGSVPPELRPSTRDVTRVGVALARLAREGRVERTNRTWESNTWAPKRKSGGSDGAS